MLKRLLSRSMRTFLILSLAGLAACGSGITINERVHPSEVTGGAVRVVQIIAQTDGMRGKDQNILMVQELDRAGNPLRDSQTGSNWQVRYASEDRHPGHTVVGALAGAVPIALGQVGGAAVGGYLNPCRIAGRCGGSSVYNINEVGAVAGSRSDSVAHARGSGTGSASITPPPTPHVNWGM